jgi:hypothetical protein
MEWPYHITRLFSSTNLLICHSYQQFLKITEYFMVTTFKMQGVAQHTPAGRRFRTPGLYYVILNCIHPVYSKG